MKKMSITSQKNINGGGFFSDFGKNWMTGFNIIVNSFKKASPTAPVDNKVKGHLNQIEETARACGLR